MTGPEGMADADHRGEVPRPGPTGATRVAAVIGDPVRHSLSPVIHNAAFATEGLDWVYVAFPVAAGHAGGAIAAMRTLGLGGLSVTMPHKQAVAALVDRCTPVAERLGAVNCVSWEGDALVGDNTDGVGFLTSLRAGAGFDPAGRRCAVLGAGGAARAVVLALAEGGAAEVVVVNRTEANGEAAAALAGPIGRTGSVDEVGDADLVVQATPVGMGADARLPYPPELLRAGQVVADLVYEPAETPLVAEARRRGARTLGGVGMLVHQAAAAFERWTGHPAPVTVMEAAAAAALADRSSA